MPPAKQPHGDFVSGTSKDRRTPALRYAEDYFKDSDEDEDGSDDDTSVPDSGRNPVPFMPLPHILSNHSKKSPPFNSRPPAADPLAEEDHERKDVYAKLADMEKRLNELQLENLQLRGLADTDDIGKPWPLLHRVLCLSSGSNGPVTYLDKPILVDDRGVGHSHWQGLRRLPSEGVWERSRQSSAFVVYQEWKCRHRVRKLKPRHSTEIQPSEESVKILSRTLRDFVYDAFEACKGLELFLNAGIFDGHTFHAPYIFFAHFANEITTHSETASPDQRRETKDLIEYLTTSTQSRIEEAEAAFSKGEVNTKLLPYFFKPGGLVCAQQDGLWVVHKQNSLLSISDGNRQASNKVHVSFDSTRIIFDGRFRVVPDKNPMSVTEFGFDQLAHKSIDSLSVLPIERMQRSIVERLTARGRNFYKCRDRRYVTCSSNPRSVAPEDSMVDTRYMVDVQSYHSLHGNDTAPSSENQEQAAVIVDGSGDDDAFVVQLPQWIQGFNMSDKKWVTLPVEDLIDVVWNEVAFENLAVPDNTKELIQALVQNKIDVERGLDFVRGKGTGLVVLLHGGPGTGKTLTAESVAEVARRPLYRVTCGDLGTDAQIVEKYLNSVLQLARRWGCVVLLDEADVFLEQRSFANLDRNALVSVFLRVIEYYDGILILTSNRVGTFDEAFKSRIQLSLQYRKLDAGQRRKIWNNFLDRLETVGECTDGSIRAHVKALAQIEMNGRQIRNSITTARQLALFRKRPMGFRELEDVIKVGSEFEKYISDLNDGEDDESIARERNDR